jgi:hypothetical protein
MPIEARYVSTRALISGTPEWPLAPISVQAGQPGFDLKPTLPAGAVAGGVFGVHESTPFPDWLALSADGVVKALPMAAVSSAQVVFTYLPPPV